MSRALQSAGASARRSPLDAWFRHPPSGRAPSSQAALRFEDLSWRPRFGCKGPAAQAWLSGGGYKVPPMPNTTAVDSAGVLVASLGTAEFLVEAMDGGDDHISSAIQHLASAGRPPDVYPVARFDLVLGISGPGTDALLRQICSVNFAPLLASAERHAGPVILTSMIGVGVAAWPRLSELGPAVTLWIDPSFAHYFWTTLLEVGHETGGVTIGESNAVGHIP